MKITIREIVLRENELNEKIQFYINELETIVDLMTIDKYRNSKTLIAKYEAIENKAFELIEERNNLKEYIEVSNTILAKVVKPTSNKINNIK